MRPLKALIADYMSVPGNVPDVGKDAQFLSAALRTAVSSARPARANILRDVADVLGCDIEDLSFLFGAEDFGAPARGYEMLVPDYQTQLLAAAE